MPFFRDCRYDSRDYEDVITKIGTVNARLARIERWLENIARAQQVELEYDRMAQADIDKIRSEVARNRDATKAAILLIQNLAQRVRDLADDPAELQALAAELESNASTLGQAITENTPSSS